MRKPTKPKNVPADDYEVGHRKPPTEHQFRAGEVHNPHGRPPRLKTFNRFLGKVLTEKVTITIGGQRTKFTKREAIARRLMEKFTKGDATAQRLVLALVAEFDRELMQGQNQVHSGVVQVSDDYHAVKKEAFEALRRNNSDGDEFEQRRIVQRVAVEKTGRSPTLVGPLIRRSRRR